MNKIPFILFGWVGACSLIFITNWLVLAVRKYKLKTYLKENYYQVWRELSSIGEFGPGLSNPFRWFNYIFNDSYEGDELLTKLKDTTLRWGRAKLICCNNVKKHKLSACFWGYIALLGGEKYTFTEKMLNFFYRLVLQKDGFL